MRICVLLVRNEGLKGVRTVAVVSADETSKVGHVTHDNSISLQEAIIRGVDHWIKTTEQGKLARMYACDDFNIGDLASYTEDQDLIRCLENEGVTNLEITMPDFTTDWTYDTPLCSPDDDYND
jgi:hypothetical protein